MIDAELLAEEFEWQDRPWHGLIFNTCEFLKLAKKNGIYWIGFGYWNNQFKDSGKETIKYIKYARSNLKIKKVGNGIIRVPGYCFADEVDAYVAHSNGIQCKTKIWNTTRDFESLFDVHEFFILCLVELIFVSIVFSEVFGNAQKTLIGDWFMNFKEIKSKFVFNKNFELIERVKYLVHNQ